MRTPPPECLMDDPPPVPPVPHVTTAYQTIRRALAHAWPTDNDKDVRRLTFAIMCQAGPALDRIAPSRIAIAVRVIGAVRQGVDAGVWPGAHDIRAASDIILAGLDFALADMSSIALAMLLRQLSTGYAEAIGVDALPGGRPHDGLETGCAR